MQELHHHGDQEKVPRELLWRPPNCLRTPYKRQKDPSFAGSCRFNERPRDKLILLSIKQWIARKRHEYRDSHPRGRTFYQSDMLFKVSVIVNTNEPSVLIRGINSLEIEQQRQRHGISGLCNTSRWVKWLKDHLPGDLSQTIQCAALSFSISLSSASTSVAPGCSCARARKLMYGVW